MEFNLSHIGIWTCEIERSRAFYQTYFGGACNEKYTNPTKGFASYFLTFSNGVALEIMQRSDVTAPNSGLNRVGLAHLAFSVGTPERVDRFVQQIRLDGYTIHSEPRTTGDGFYEASIVDPDGNIIEIVA